MRTTIGILPLVLALGAFLQDTSLYAQSGGGVPDRRGTPEDLEPDDSEFEGEIEWIESLGEKASAVEEDLAPKKGEVEEIYEIRIARDLMMPILVYFFKGETLEEFGDKKRQNPEVAACERLDEDLWRRREITVRASEFICIRVDMRKADPSLLKKHKVRKAPTLVFLDYRFHPLLHLEGFRSGPAQLAKTLDSVRKSFESLLKRFAASREETPFVKKARDRLRVLEQWDAYLAGMEVVKKKFWARAEERFRKGLEIKDESVWRERCDTGLLEIEAGKKLLVAEQLIRARRFAEARDFLSKLLADYTAAEYHALLAQKRLLYVEKKLK